MQCFFAGLGLWQLVAYQVEILWAAPIASHVIVAAMTTYGLAAGRNNAAERRLLWLWVVASVCASVASASFLVGSALGRVEQATAQCAACVMILSVKSFRDGSKARLVCLVCFGHIRVTDAWQGIPQDGSEGTSVIGDYPTSSLGASSRQDDTISPSGHCCV